MTRFENEFRVSGHLGAAFSTKNSGRLIQIEEIKLESKAEKDGKASFRSAERKSHIESNQSDDSVALSEQYFGPSAQAAQN